jgi:DNA polymerase-4
VVAKIASEQAKPDGLVEVAIGEEAAFLKPLAIGRLPGIGKKTERIFRGLGISTIGKLASMPPSALKGHLGTYGEVLHGYARGRDSRRVEPPAEAKSISRETTFGTDTWDRAFLEATLRYLSEKVGAKLRQRNRQAHCVTLKLRYADFTTLTRRLTLNQATDSDQVIFSTGLKLMQKALRQQKQAVRLIGIGVSGFCEAASQLDMLDTQAARQEILETTIDRIRRKYGFTAIQTGRTLKLKDIFGHGEGSYKLTTPSLSR